MLPRDEMFLLADAPHKQLITLDSVETIQENPRNSRRTRLPDSPATSMAAGDSRKSGQFQPRTARDVHSP